MSERSSPGETAARVIESFGRRVIVETADGARLPAELFGKRLSCVCGDDVSVRVPAAGSGDVTKVTAVAPRRTLFARTDSRGRTEPLAANLSLLVVIIAPHPEPDPYIADRYLAGAALAGISGIVVVNKSELPGAAAAPFRALIEEYERGGYRVLKTSALHLDSIEPLRARLAGEVAMLVGQSGVGKSTLTNRLAPESARATREISDATGEGRHTTVSTALFHLRKPCEDSSPAVRGSASAGDARRLEVDSAEPQHLLTGSPDGAGELIDSPGVRDYAPPLVEDASVQVGWPEIIALATRCRFNNCLHLREPGCAVTGAVAASQLSARRYESYKRLLNIMRGLAPQYERRR